MGKLMETFSTLGYFLFSGYPQQTDVNSVFSLQVHVMYMYHGWRTLLTLVSTCSSGCTSQNHVARLFRCVWVLNTVITSF